jgi:hypothetical protein
MSELESCTVFSRSKMPTIETSDVSLNSAMKLFTMPGMTCFNACGRMMNTIDFQ